MIEPVAKRLRIAVLTRNFSPGAGGAERYSMALVRELSARHEIHVFAQSIGPPPGDQSLPGVTYHRVSMPMRRPRWINQLWFAGSTWWATRQGQGFDVVHSHENTWHGDVQTVHVLPVRHNLFSGQSGFVRLVRWLKVLTSPRLTVYLWLEQRRYAPKPGRAVLVTSPSLQTLFSSAYPRAASMTAVITPGIELPAELPTVQSRQQARQQLGLPEEGHCVLLVGHDLRKKGLDALLEAFRTLAFAGAETPTFIAVVGSTLQVPHFRQMAEKSGLASRVFFLGELQDVSPAYRAADCLAHPTLEDTFAMVVLEAMAHGLPVIVSGVRYCGISGLLEHGVNALILDNPRDALTLQTELQRVLSDVALRASLSQHARQFASRHQWSDVSRLQEQVYVDAIAAKRLGRPCGG